MFSSFFIRRPRFAMVIASVLVLAGVIAGFNLPIKQYPDVSPPTVQIFASYPGADAATVANTIAAPLEDAMNGVDNMLFMESTSSNSGVYNLTITFRTGTNPDMALINVQNRIQQVSQLLPTEVTQNGLNVIKSFSDMLGFVALSSPNGTRDSLYLLDYAYNNVGNALKRVPGVGNVQIFGARYSIRVWLDPEKLASRGLGASDVTSAIASQNRQASLGSVGTGLRDTGSETAMVYSLATRGRLSSVREFEDIIVRTTEQGGVVKLRDVARIELGAESYSMNASLNGSPVAAMMLSQASDANAIEVMNAVKNAIDGLSESLPDDVEFVMGYDSTEYVRETINEILMTLALTFSLVVFVCYLFLQDWRVTLVPVAAIPISLVATLIGLRVMDFSINILTLFGLVLVIGTVVDDAIIVVERVMFVMERDGSNSRDATLQAMKDVTGPMTATTLVFLAIFVPVTFMQGITGVIYRQFAVTISFSVVFSLIVALTLSPAMCAHMLDNVKPKKRGPLAWFNRGLAACTRGYVSGALWIARKTIVVILLFAAVTGSAYYLFRTTPTEFIPMEDQGMIMAMIQLPEGASQARTKAVLDEFVPRVRAIPGVKLIIGVEGFSVAGDSGENVGTVVIALDDWRLRKSGALSQRAIYAAAQAIASEIPEATINLMSPPAIPGLGMGDGIEMQLQSRMDGDPVKLAQTMNEFMVKMFQSPEFALAFSTYTADTPHLFLDIDREKAEMMKVPVSNIFSTMQTYFGTAYVNDINIGSQVNKVIIQSDWMFRNSVDSINNIYVKSSAGTRVPMQAIATVRQMLEPRSIGRYNLYPSATVRAMMKPGFSTGQGIARVQEIARELPDGYVIEWSGMTYQEQEAAGQTVMIIAIALAFGYLFLVAQYESWTVPMGVILSLPVAVLGALIGLRIMSISVSIYTQLGILLLVGLAAKNAILIVEFAQEQHEINGYPILDSVAEAGRERFRSVMMTALTCVIGVAPMLAAKGAGAGSRMHVGTTMFFGMSMATVFGIFLIPGLYVVLQTNRERIKKLMSSLFSRKNKAEDIPSDETRNETN
jgi:hydrophobe/amphiphile efflux-1 (HAE1) family protein